MIHEELLLPPPLLAAAACVLGCRRWRGAAVGMLFLRYTADVLWW
jgi:hypothetical protein